ncbi:MAG: type secretion system protein ImpL, partial [Verrucomicrobiota bacterium]
MDDDSKIQSFVKWGLGALGLSSVVSAVAIPHIGIWVALFILALALLLFGGYYLWQRSKARRQREQFTSAIEEQTAAAPRTISDPKKRADLDKVRGKFQTGLQEFRSRGKDIYQLPWYVIIGESGSGKSEAIRHSEIDFPPGLNKEHQGTGGTVNMDWWFSNRGVILDTAGSMLFPEAGAGDAPEWTEFLRLLKKARPQCPVNGLFLVLSIESLIKDSADKISQKASRLAQHLDLIQRTLDVRFPVYLLVTKCDLLTGFREFFDSIEDPLLQHQIFGWSNPDPLDAPFRPDLIEQHLGSVAERVSRRRLALLRETSPAGRLGGDTQQFFASSYQLGKGPAGARRLDEVDSMFALPESIMRLAPRLRRYLETIFVAGEWSAKPVFLRGIYFTSSMREGKALDEAIAFATGLPLDQLPEDRTWDKNRAFFLRDLFHEKVFRESGLVTRATNTLKLLRQRQLVIFGSAGAALLLVLIFAFFSYRGLQKSVLKEAAYWQAGATNWNQGEWSNSIVRAGTAPNVLHFSYAGTNVVETGSARPTLIEYHQWLRKIAEKPLPVGLVFKPLEWMHIGSVHDRPAGQRLLFEGSVLRPLIARTRDKMRDTSVGGTPVGPKALDLHRNALLALMRIEADGLLASPNGITSTNEAQKYLKSFLSYLTDMDFTPDPALVDVFAWTYSK